MRKRSSTPHREPLVTTSRWHQVSAAALVAVVHLAALLVLDPFASGGLEVSYRHVATSGTDAPREDEPAGDEPTPDAPPDGEPVDDAANDAPENTPVTEQDVAEQSEVDIPRELDREVYPSTIFPNQHRVFSRYQGAWDYERFGKQSEALLFDVEIRTTVALETQREVRVVAHRPDQVEVRWQVGAVVPGDDPAEVPELDPSDGRIVAQNLVSPGAWPLQIRWQGTVIPMWEFHLRDFTGLRLEWREPGGIWEPIPLNATAPEASFPPLRTLLWVSLFTFLVLFILFVWSARSSLPARERIRRSGIYLTLIVLGLGGLFRFVDYDVIPHTRATHDELFSAWNGYQLLEDGGSIGWTTFGDTYLTYPDLSEHYVDHLFGREFFIVEPYVEHPPLMHLLSGAAVHIGGAHAWYEAKHGQFRIIAIAINLLCLYFIILVGRRAFPESYAPWCAGLLYAVIPFISLQGRLAKEESLLSLLFIASTYVFQRWRDGSRGIALALLGASLAGLCALTKLPGIVMVLAFTLLIARHSYKQAFAACAVGFLVSGLVVVYGHYLGWELFSLITERQTVNRAAHWGLFIKYFKRAIIEHNIMGEGWLAFLWLAFVAGFARFRARAREAMDPAVYVPLVAYLIAIGLGAGAWHFGWYAFPLYPFLCLGAGKYLADLYASPTMLRALPLIAFALPFGLMTMVPAPSFEEGTSILAMATSIESLSTTLVVAVGVLGFAAAELLKSQRLGRALALVATLTLVVTCGHFVLNYPEVGQALRDYDVH